MSSPLHPSRPMPAKPPGAARSVRSRIRADRLATFAVSAGGIAIIASILAILVFIAAEVVPLTWPARVETAATVGVPPSPVRALTADPYRTHVATLSDDGEVRVVRTADGAIVARKRIVAEGIGVVAAAAPQADTLTASTDDGRVVLVAIAWQIGFAGGRRVVTPEIGAPASVEIDPEGRPLRAFAARVVEGAGPVAAGQTADGKVALVRVEREENVFTGEVGEKILRTETEAVAPLSALALDGRGRNVFGGDEAGRLSWWAVGGDGGASPASVTEGESAVTTLALLIAERSLIVGRADGRLDVWILAPREEAPPVLTRIRRFPPFPAAVTEIAPSRRDKGFLATDADGHLGLFYSTSGRVLWQGDSPVPDVTALSYAPKADGAYVAGGGEMVALEVVNPHPEASLAALFSPVWYEGYPEPSYVWQSSSGSDDFEPKLSLIPLLVGTLKGTLYSLLIAIPLGVFGAMYVALFMAPRLKSVVKPAIEIMAALPSVVLGFLAGLWLAPRLEELFPALLSMLLTFPVAVLAGGLTWERLPARWRLRVPTGAEALFFVVFLAAGFYACILASPAVERMLFGRDFPAWLLGTTGLPYDQRNAIVVGIAMGFAVIPIIFAISEDAFSNVPGSLVSGSLALGANRWQTAMRVVLPTASPGIFSAIMVGFGRAVGETMIVLMATGNTPILDWNPFSGFRTLSANIAVEIPEAPQFGTLYRVLFLAALLLFVLTFLVNTAAEIVRSRLRRRFAEL